MYSPSKNALDSKSFLWTFPECPVRIHVNLQFIDRLRAEVLAAPADREAGGLLIGNVLSRNGDIEVSDYFRLQPSSESARNFVVCSDSLTRAIQNWSGAHRRVIGFYRTHSEQRIHLRAEDQECIKSKFNDPTNVFLVVRPHDGRASAVFFFWQDGSVVGGLTFPFSSTELGSPSWTTLVGGTRPESRLHSLLGYARDRAQRVSPGMRIGLFVLVAILLAVAGAWRLYYSPSDTPHTLGLRVDRGLLGVVIAWNPAASEVATASDSNLLIWDGSSPPAFVRLTTAQLRSGRAFFTSVSDRVEVRLDVIGTAGRARTESIVSVSHAPDFSPSELPAPGTSAPIPTPEASRPPVAKTSENGSAKKPTEESTAPARVVSPATPSPSPAKSSATPTTPGPKSSGTLAELSKRPDVLSPGVGGPALDQTFHALDTRPTVVPHAAEQPGRRSFQTAVAIRATRPEIPTHLKTMIHSDNVVEVQVTINASGKVTAAKLAGAKGPVADLLSKLAVDAALGWQFRPATQNGEAVSSEKILEFLFRSSNP